ncbi:hypothetical protein [Streptomyces sp. NPDC094466]|uniref:hypothetical protein n=1 Tax=Streptomyces sp. NPDC094466 TaxID=3366065 RepID=UPI003824914D
MDHVDGRDEPQEKPDPFPPGMASITTEDMMSVSLEHGSILKRLTVTGQPVADRELRARLLRAASS